MLARGPFPSTWSRPASASMRLVQQSILYGLGGLCSASASFLSTVITVHYLTAADYGLMGTVVAAVGWMVLLITCGNPGPMTRFFMMAEGADDRRVYVSGWMSLMLAISLALMLALVPLSDRIAAMAFSASGSGGVIVWAAISAIASLFFGLCLQVARFQQRVWVYTLLQLLLGSISIGLVWTAVRLDGGVRGILMATAGSSLLLLPVGLFLIRSSLTLRWSPVRIVEMIRYGLPLVPMAVVWAGLATVDRLLLLDHDAASAGRYAVAAKVTVLIGFVNMAFGTAWSPRAFEWFLQDRDSVGARFGTLLTGYLVATCWVAMAVAALAREVVGLMAAEEFLPASSLVGLLVVAIIADGSTYVTQIGFSVHRRSGLMVIPPCAALLVNVLLNLLLISRFGAIGAGVASVISYLVLAVTFYAFGQQFIRIVLPRTCVAFLGTFLAGIAACSFLSAREGSLPLRLGVLAVFSVFAWRVGRAHANFLFEPMGQVLRVFRR